MARIFLDIFSTVTQSMKIETRTEAHVLWVFVPLELSPFRHLLVLCHAADLAP